MCRNIFVIQQSLTTITMSREVALDYARQYYELFYHTIDEILTTIVEKGSQFQLTEYMTAITLLHRSGPTGGGQQSLDASLKRLTEILNEVACNIMIDPKVTICKLVTTQCLYRGQCGIFNATNPTPMQFPIPCVVDGKVVDGKPKPLNETNSDVLRQIVPELFKGDKPVFCCDDDQASLLMSGQIEKAAFTRRCPSCYVNFAKILIHMSCHPNHREFLKVTATATAETDPKKQMLTELSYYMSRTYVDNAYNSCVSVQAPSFGSTVIKPLCGNYGAEHCSPDRWVESIGTKNPSPFQINFHITTDETIDGHKPMNQTPWSCKAAPTGYSNQPCSCADCPAVCPFQKHSYPEPDIEWTCQNIFAIPLNTQRTLDSFNLSMNLVSDSMPLFARFSENTDKSVVGNHLM
ncbi:unnamed protein product [Oppiella nova]|uniref:Niemann-Pick C1 N-terminal domain-containing protein n=1 Tax=Oppiella nova TaxID=334625 RepID=A0A7R9MFA5_9ACAR|nr:unnamed protein product [Oppiella nova]CAG2175099.1 unnamed protein product [Oppiella nova]